MAAFELLLSQARRHCFCRTPYRLSIVINSHSSPNPSFLWFHKSLSSSSPSSPSSPSSSEPILETQPNEINRRPPAVPVSIQPVSYPVKPKDPSPPQEAPSQPPRRFQQPDLNLENPVTAEDWRREDIWRDPSPSWNREDIRYMKDVSPVSPMYPTRVAPLPEDRVQVSSATEEDEAKDEVEKREDMEGNNELLEAERRRIESNNRVLRRAFRVEDQNVVPFPTLIKVENKKKEKVIHDLKEAIQLVKASAKRNFDETLEAHVKLAVDLRRTDLKLSGSLSLPHGSGKSLRVAVFAEGASADEARAAGADIVGGQELIDGIKNGSVNVKEINKCIAVPQLMPRIGKEISKKLSRLTPNARDGSVTTDISRAVKEAKKNTFFKKDKSAIVHVGLGKVSYTEEALCENVGAFVNALLLAKPVGLKKSSKYAGYVNTFHICSTMGPSFPVSIQSLSIAADRYTKLQLR